MKIETYILPRFKRFRTLNPGIKRLLFALTFPVFAGALILFIGSVICLLILPYEDPVGEIAAISSFVVLSYFAFWIVIRVIIWVYDGFFPANPSNLNS